MKVRFHEQFNHYISDDDDQSTVLIFKMPRCCFHFCRASHFLAYMGSTHMHRLPAGARGISRATAPNDLKLTVIMTPNFAAAGDCRPTMGEDKERMETEARKKREAGAPPPAPPPQQAGERAPPEERRRAAAPPPTAVVAGGGGGALSNGAGDKQQKKSVEGQLLVVKKLRVAVMGKL